MATKWGIYSAGNVCHDFVTSIRSMESSKHQVIAVAARELSSAQIFAGLHSISRAYGSYEELAKDKDVDVVYIGTITCEHLNAAKLMLNNGKHVLVEKALTVNTRETRELLTLAKSKKLFVMEAMWNRFLPLYNFVFDQIKKGVIGDVMYVNVSLGLNYESLIRKAKRELCGGTVLNLGGYVISFVEQVFNGEMPVKIKAVGHLNEFGVDFGFSAALEYTYGKKADISTNILIELQNKVTIIGTNGSIRLANNFYNTNTVYINDIVYEFELPEPIIPLVYGNIGLCYQANEVRKCINEGLLESEIMSHKDSLTISKIQDEIRMQLGVKYHQDD